MSQLEGFPEPGATAPFSLAHFGLAGKKVLLTGGSRGLGVVLAEGLARAGADVAVTAASNPDLAEQTAARVRALGRRSLALQGDISRQADCGLMAERVLGEWGRVDVLVNNAAVISRKFAMDEDEADWDRVMAVNIKGTFLMTRSLVRSMAEQGGGAVVNVASVLGWRPSPTRFSYSISKAGVHQLTRALAVEWSPLRVRVNAVAPGYLATPGVENYMRANPAFHREILERTPQRRILALDEVVGSVIFLASDAARAITGHILYVDGGYTAV